MDLGLYLRVLWRFRLLAVAGLLLAVSLALLSFVRISPDGLTYRQAEQWEATTTILLTGRDAPWYRSSLQEPVIDPETGRITERSADPSWLTIVGFVYSQFAVSDEVKRLMLREGEVDGSIVASPLDPEASIPVIRISALAGSPDSAIALARRGANAFFDFIVEQQRVAEIPADERVQLQVLSKPQEATLIDARKRTRPIVIFITVMMATLGLIFVLENLKPRIRTARRDDEPSTEQSVSRRSA